MKDSISGNNISPAVLASVLLLTQHNRVNESLKNITKYRPFVHLTPAVSKG